MKRLFQLCLLSSLVLGVLVSTRSFAADPLPNQKPELHLTHQPLAEKDLPFPGNPLTLTAYLKRDPSTANLRMRGLIVRDGRLIDLQSAAPSIDKNDRVFFSLEVPSPAIELSYQFLFYYPDGKSRVSEQFSIRRSCIPKIQLTKVQSTETVGRDDIPKLMEQSTGLQRELELYERAIVLLEQIKKTVEKK